MRDKIVESKKLNIKLKFFDSTFFNSKMPIINRTLQPMVNPISQSFRGAIKSGCIETIRTVLEDQLENSAQINYIGTFGETIFHIALSTDQWYHSIEPRDPYGKDTINMIAYLVSQGGIHWDKADWNGATVLHHTAGGYGDRFKAALRAHPGYRSMIDSTDSSGCTPLDYAIQAKNSKTIRILKALGAELKPSLISAEWIEEDPEMAQIQTVIDTALTEEEIMTIRTKFIFSFSLTQILILPDSVQ